MPNTRVMLMVAFAAILYLNYEAWMHDYREPAAVGASSQPAPGASGASNTLADSVPKAETATASATAQAPRSYRGAAARRLAASPGEAAAPDAASPMLHVRDRCARCRHQFEGRRDRPRRPHAISAAQGHTQHPGAARKQRARSRCICCRAGSSVSTGEAAPTHLAHVDRRADVLRAVRGRQRIAGADDLVGWSGFDGHEDIRVHSRLVRHRPELRGPE